ncbi:MAG: hypothetical protein IPO41_07200 [Acidobacteria bacterium]|nr:hypothetical protein [Acidobacteriota bacterium]
MLSCLLGLEKDASVTSYYEPQMNLVFFHEGEEHPIPVHIWASHGSGPASLIGIIDSETELLFERHPEILAKVEEQARAINARYVPIRESDLSDWVVGPSPGEHLDCEMYASQV